MYGLSVFLGEELSNETKMYIQKMKKIGFNGIFSSLHIPEEDATLYLDRLKALGKIAREEKMKLMVDISGEALERAGLSFSRLKEMTDIGVTGLRMDYEISNEQIANASHTIDIGLNASTVTEIDIQELKKYDADFSRFEVWHNYYPRPETGLSDRFLKEKNTWLKKVGFQVYAFVSGNEVLRGPLFEKLPTLERHRYINPFTAAVELMNHFMVDAVYIGDPTINLRTMNQFEFFNTEKSFPIEVEDIGSKYYNHILGEHVNRQDDARDVIRSANARFLKVPQIEPEILEDREKGDITIDNEKYGRYMGEIQIIRKKLPKNEKINTVAKVTAEDAAMIDLIKAGTKFTLLKRGTL
ncbi:DUF871 domain-containing protein [Enterococcus rivorum]|uniref:Histidine kinase n=1 Tax=Enterococcus rivorum TaxID=762845 RepID=A0A1E5KWR3_9ENTE|nr:MupG family TIM beta-alpha barrel fold protein [Enterococcus rivorum]MBP2100131.1 hypothetical protein [Enterococcus rivorum]OEH82079.1 histidine kinase [Enterococcus rivorum]